MVVMNGEEYFTAEEARALLGVKAATLYAYVSRGLLSSYRQGIKRQRLYKKSQVEALVGFKPGGDIGGASNSSQTTAEREANDPQIPAAESWIPYV
ncbi:MAG TPA: helix-turn-helix domain-containing protein [Ktedonobacterales bacterium]|nr:helix-turn-helix domain-containing protein [Ktedonobacterales bacterium]